MFGAFKDDRTVSYTRQQKNTNTHTHRVNDGKSQRGHRGGNDDDGAGKTLPILRVLNRLSQDLLFV